MIEAGFFEKAYSILADKAEAKRKGAIAWAPHASTWELVRRALSDVWKSTDQLALETDRSAKAIRIALANHRKQVSMRKVKRPGRLEWRARAGREGEA